MSLDEVKKLAVLRALDGNKGNISKAAKDLGIGRATLYRMIKKWNLAQPIEG